ncbi:MAG: Lipoprotein signal peptidase [Opitutia bacterium UBA7350]|nr:MAG: Lipoprotein signal peptidase [Opitutae bacterium UBA7350]
MLTQTGIRGIVAYKRLICTAVLVFLLDQSTKLWVSHELPINTYNSWDSITIIPDFFYIIHIGNYGAAWGILEGQGLLLAAFALVALFTLFVFRKTLELHCHLEQWIFGLMIGGIVGNLADRCLRGYVIDFLDFHLPFSIPYILEGGRYPAFNVADCGIVIGVFAFLTLNFIKKDPK